MAESEHPVVAARLRLTRANEHISTLSKLIEDWDAGDPYELVEDQRPDQCLVLWRIRIHRDPPAQLGLVVGDAVHGMRAALDNLFWAFALRHQDPPKNPTRLQFPIWKDRIGSMSWESTGKRMLEHVSPEVGEVIRGVQPWQQKPDQPSIDKLWVLDRLWNDDKHRTVVPVFTCVTEPEMIVRHRYGPTDGELGVPHLVDGPLHDGDIIASMTFDPAVFAEIEAEVDFKGSFFPGFPADGPALGAPLDLCLKSLHRYLDLEVLPQFEAL